MILDGMLEIKTEMCWFLYLTEGTDGVVNSIADDVWGAKDELIYDLSDKVDSWDWLYL